MWLATLAFVALAPAIPPGPAGRITLHATITKVMVGQPGDGPRLLVDSAPGVTWTIWLGSFRYLMAQGFNPKAGQRVTIQGFPAGERQLLTQVITLEETGYTLRLRDAQGRPVWRGGANAPPIKPDPPPR